MITFTIRHLYFVSVYQIKLSILKLVNVKWQDVKKKKLQRWKQLCKGLYLHSVLIIPNKTDLQKYIYNFKTTDIIDWY